MAAAADSAYVQMHHEEDEEKRFSIVSSGESVEYVLFKKDRNYIFKYMHVLLGHTIPIEIRTIDHIPDDDMIIINEQFNVSRKKAKELGFIPWKPGLDFPVKVIKIDHKIGNNALLINDFIEIPYSEALSRILLIRAKIATRK